MTSKEQLNLIHEKLLKGERLDSAELVSMLTPEMISRMLDMNSEAGRKSGQAQKEDEIVCRLIASGMPEDEIAVILCIKTDDVSRIARCNKELIIKYARQLKSRRRYRSGI